MEYEIITEVDNHWYAEVINLRREAEAYQRESKERLEDIVKLSWQLDKAIELLDNTSRVFFMDNYED